MDDKDNNDKKDFKDKDSETKPNQVSYLAVGIALGAALGVALKNIGCRYIFIKIFFYITFVIF